jgi:iron complex outermembrane receptor protein
VLDTITVEASGQSGASPLGGLVPSVTATATKTDTALLETPQSISVVGAEQIAATGAQTIASALDYVPGVLAFAADDITGDSLFTRGFRIDPYYGNVFRDGLRAAVNVFDGAQEPYGLERVELLRGPSSILYGQAGPAGILNTVSKRPPSEPLREVNLQAGSYDRAQVSADFGGPIGDGTLSWRLTGLARNADTYVDHIPNDRRFLAPALAWTPGPNTSLTVLGLYQHDKSVYNDGLPIETMLAPNPNGDVPRSLFVGEPGFDRNDITQKSVTTLFEHAFSDAVRFRSNARWFRSDGDMPSIYGDYLNPDMRTLHRSAQKRTDWSESFVTDNNLTIDWAHAGSRHATLVGFDAGTAEHSTERYNGTVGPLDLFDPVYGGPIGGFAPMEWSNRDRADRYGLYLQDQMWIGERWVVTVGGRQDWVTYNAWPVFGGPKLSDDETTDAFTGRAGIVYLAPNGLAPYLSFSQSFEPTNGFDRRGERFLPSTGEQWEAGVRYQLPDRDVLLSAAVYQITQQNVNVPDPVDSLFEIQQGEVRSRGVELEARGSVTDDLDLIAAYAYTDARTTRSSPATPEAEGQRTGGVPYNQASLWADYDFTRLGLPGLSAGLGIRYVGETTPTWGTGTVPAYTIVDASATWTSGNWQARLNATNLTDKGYVAACTYHCFWGEPRQVLVTASYSW